MLRQKVSVLDTFLLRKIAGAVMIAAPRNVGVPLALVVPSREWLGPLAFRPQRTAPATCGLWPRAEAHVKVGRMRQWKIALSLAIVGAISAPIAFRTYKAWPEVHGWEPSEKRLAGLN
jgi:hypothetical protein